MKGLTTVHTALTLAATLAIGATLLGVPGAAQATVYRDTSAGGACHPAYGASTKFTFNNTYAENISTTDQYVICHFAMADTITTPRCPNSST